MKSSDFPGNPRPSVDRFRTPAAVPQANPSQRKSRAAMLEKMDSTEHEPLLSGLSAADSTLQEVPVTSLVVSPYQPRIVFDSQAIAQLADSISEIGLGKPILVRPLPGDKFEIVGGERRWRAVSGLGWDKISAVVKVMSDDIAMLLALTDNEHEQLTDYELARSYDRYLKDGAEKSQSSIARRLGVNRSVISRCLDLMKLSPKILSILDQQPDLITSHYAKKFVELSVDHLDIVEDQVSSMAQKGIKQEQALRIISQKIATSAENSVPISLPRTVPGIGTLKVTDRKLELKFEKGISAKNLIEQFDHFLLSLDRTKLRTEDSKKS
jgi:ParB family chromosome partitioning protein